MPVYTAKAVSKHNTNPLYKARGISGYQPCKLSELERHGVPWIRQIAYEGYKNNIDIFVAATNRGKKLSTDLEGAFLSNGHRYLIDLPHPAIQVIFKERRTGDQMGAMKVKWTRFEADWKKVGNTQTMIIRKPVREILPFLADQCKTDITTDKGFITWESYQAYIHHLMVISEFLATNTYAAMTDAVDPMARGDEEYEDDAKEISRELHKMMIDHVEGVADASSGQTAYTLTRLTSDVVNQNAVIAEHNMAQELGQNQMEYPEQKFETYAEITPFILNKLTIKAKPSPRSAKDNCGPVSKIPYVPGLVFPYFEGSILPDFTTIKDIFFKYFFRTMGDSRDACMSGFSFIKKYTNKAMHRPEFQVLAHLYFGIDLCLQTQTRLYAIVGDKEYVGYCLLGAGWNIHFDNEWIGPLMPKEFLEQVQELASHKRAVREICDVLSELTLKVPTEDGTVRRVTPEEITSSRKLLAEICARNLPNTAKEDLWKWCQLIGFRGAYRTFNDSNIIWALEMMTTKANVPFDEEKDAMVYIVPSLENVEDRIYQVLASFGPESFSFLNSSGRIYSIPPSGLYPPKEDGSPSDPHMIPTHPDHISEVIIARKGITTAYGDMRHVFKEKEVMFDTSERARESRCIVFRGDVRSRLYGALKATVGDLTSRAAKESAGLVKRKRALSDVGGDDRVSKTDFASFLDNMPE